ncbi:MAG: septum formation initiator family protein [Bacteroidota bacterium]|nr:septum formation initiator family protein [Bacteroidota bacterium]
MGKEKSFYIQIIKLIANKYIITIFLFSIWMLFIDDYNLINKKATIEKINYLQERKKFLSNEIKKDSIKKVLLENNVNEQERIAREKYLMKKDNEDLFIIR